jgi:hypothetical protein
MPIEFIPIKPTAALIPVIPSWVIIPVVMFDRICAHANGHRRWAIRRVIAATCGTEHAETQEGESYALHGGLLVMVFVRVMYLAAAGKYPRLIRRPL